MTIAQIVETSVTKNSSFQNYTHPDDHTTQTTDTPGFKPFTLLRSLGRQSERLANNYISYAMIVRRIRQQLWFNHRCKDLGLVPAGLRLRSPLNTQEAIQIVKSTCRRLVKARITSRLNRPITFNRPDLITSSTDNYSSLDSEDDYRTDSRNVSHQKQFLSELHTPGRSHYTNYRFLKC